MGVPGTAHTALPRFWSLPSRGAALKAARQAAKSTAYLDKRFPCELSLHSAAVFLAPVTPARRSRPYGSLQPTPLVRIAPQRRSSRTWREFCPWYSVGKEGCWPQLAEPSGFLGFRHG